MADTKTKETVKNGNYYNELVEIELFKDNNKYKDDVFVAVNGRGMLVPRGKKVKIPRKYAIALENSRTQDIKTSDYITKKSREHEVKEQTL